MKWYSFSKTAAKAPAYIFERISDLDHACEVIRTSPREAQAIISSVISQLNSHHDDKFSEALVVAKKLLLDSPEKARSAIMATVDAMKLEKAMQAKEAEEMKKPWKAQK